MSFAIFLGLNDLSETIEKIFVGAVGGVTHPYKEICRSVASPAPTNQFLGAGDAPGRP